MPPTLEKPQEREHSLCSVVSLTYGRWTEVDHQLNSSQMQQQNSQFALHQNFSKPIDISRLMSLRMWDKISTIMLRALILGRPYGLPSHTHWNVSIHSIIFDRHTMLWNSSEKLWAIRYWMFPPVDAFLMKGQLMLRDRDSQAIKMNLAWQKL